jgi:hypothetical protein
MKWLESIFRSTYAAFPLSILFGFDTFPALAFGWNILSLAWKGKTKESRPCQHHQIFIVV